MAKKGNFYSITPRMEAGKRVVTLLIYDDIGFWGKTAADFVGELDEAAEASTKKIVVAIASGGGSVSDAFAMYNALRRYAGRIELVGRVDSIAASAATLPLIACDRIEMPENAQIMIHEPTTFAWGTLAELKSSVSMMENIIDSVVAAYVRRSGQTHEKIIEMMEATTWMSALDAQAMGFCDVILESADISMSANSRELLSRYPNLPEPIRMLVDSDEDSSDPAPNPPTDPEPQPEPDPGQDPAPEPPPEPAPAPTPNPEPEPEPDQEPDQEPTAPELVAHVYAMCRTQGIPQLAEGVLMSGALDSRSAAERRIVEAKEIAGVCLAARLPEKAADFVSASLSVDQVRARLFDQICNDDEDPISNRPPALSSAQTQSGPNPQAIYAKRKALSA